jgi:integrase
MPRRSRTDNVRKRCSCAIWKTCAHPWYLDYQRDNIRYRDNLDELIGRHVPDLLAAKDEARRAIVAKLEGRDPRGLVPTDHPTLEAMLTDYDREHPRSDRYQIPNIVKVALSSPDGMRRFGDWRITSITRDTLQQFRLARPLVAGNRDLGLLQAAFNWAVGKELLASSPFRVGDVTVVKQAREESRTRRLQPGEDERLRLAAGGRLLDLITAAIETGMREGEILSLQWHQVRFTPRAELFLPAAKTKTKRDRRVPISSVLLALLRRRRNDPAGAPLGPDAYVFGDELGRRVGFNRRAWASTVLRAHGHTPTYTKTKNLTPALQRAFEHIDLHFHDLRREAGSRWMDAGIPLATIQRWLGHANISQTSTYLGASLGRDDLDMQAYEATIGRLGQVTTRVTLRDVFGGSDGGSDTTADNRPSEKAQQNPIGHNPSDVVH